MNFRKNDRKKAVMDMWMEKGNDSVKYKRITGQAGFDKF